MSDLVDALKATAEKMSRRPWSTGIEDAFRELANEIDRRERHLDPFPYVYVGSDFGVEQTRKAFGAEKFFGPEKVSFEPRDGYEQDKEKYTET